VRLAPYVTHWVAPADLPAAYAMIAARSEPFTQIVIDWSAEA
jgi:hypothetical protein